MATCWNCGQTINGKPAHRDHDNTTGEEMYFCAACIAEQDTEHAQQIADIKY